MNLVDLEDRLGCIQEIARDARMRLERGEEYPVLEKIFKLESHIKYLKAEWVGERSGTGEPPAHAPREKEE